ncbi:MAG: sigma-70 family RNA polymerase sigma factor [Xanthomonadaceae bacterium]|nr:sigma-70 family RNA polymerase sigma factor [Xanthomonadaceae bacterium]MDE1884665.1 sigma-70 family RNA polymerase sigma factor [Xanthomonadaceae bacterium]MDE1961437.1 sigma-70 family RNA polymerase sigma factor [Xanthomonadaceae bacterium]MDE2083788.1 sigma-70 family RNA polymerase sigma factor [Xanthomonadaceae bacterium]
MLDPQTPITALLHAWREGDADALPQLTELVYAHLRTLARQRLRGARATTLDPTALVHESFLRLCNADVDWQDRAHFFALAALHMRNVLIDHARARQADKRGGSAVHVTLTAEAEVARATPELLALDAALRRLEGEDARTGKIIELTYFGGLNRDEVAHVLAVSVPTVDRGLRFGRAWLKRELAA